MPIRKLFTVFMLLAFLHYIFGCTKKVKVYQEDLSSADDTIVQVVLASGETVDFARPGGKYEYLITAITGFNERGVPIWVPLDQTGKSELQKSALSNKGSFISILPERISEVRLTKPKTIEKKTLAAQKITEVILAKMQVVTFDDEGGSYNEETGLVVGRKAGGDSVKLTLDQIQEIRISRPDAITIEEVLQVRPGVVMELILKNQSAISFHGDGGRFQQGKRIVTGTTIAGREVVIDADDILYARIRRSDPAMTTVAIFGALAAALVIAAGIAYATKESCPFVYSYDGERYVFDAEPYGGAICAGLKKSDYSRLEHLKAVNGKYRLMVKNEVPETQYTDEMKLWIIDHAPDTEVVPDPFGNMHTVKNPLTPVQAVDEGGRDLMHFLEERDEISWQTHLPTDSSFRGQVLRHQLTLAFPRPAGAKTVKLLVNGGTALWGSEMIRKMLELRGERVDDWYDAVNKGEAELAELVEFVARDELYTLKIYVKEGDDWMHRGFIPGGGPFIYEDRVIPLDISGVSEDTLRIRLLPPMGFWAMDYLAVEYGNYPFPEVQEVPVAEAKDQYGSDVSAILRKIDNQYQVLPEIGDWAMVSFDAPPTLEGKKRSVILKSTGYYEIHLSKDQPEQTELVRELISTPGMIHEFALDEYLKWRSAQFGLK